MSPTWCKKRFCESGGIKTFENKLFERTFWRENWKNFKEKLLDRGYQANLIQRTLLEENFEERKQALQQKRKENKRILPFVTQFQPLAAYKLETNSYEQMAFDYKPTIT